MEILLQVVVIYYLNNNQFNNNIALQYAYARNICYLNGKIIEAQGHAYGVVENTAYDRRGKFTLWGVPNWLQITTSTS